MRTSTAWDELYLVCLDAEVSNCHTGLCAMISALYNKHRITEDQYEEMMSAIDDRAALILKDSTHNFLWKHDADGWLQRRGFCAQQRKLCLTAEQEQNSWTKGE